MDDVLDVISDALADVYRERRPAQSTASDRLAAIVDEANDRFGTAGTPWRIVRVLTVLSGRDDRALMLVLDADRRIASTPPVIPPAARQVITRWADAHGYTRVVWHPLHGGIPPIDAERSHHSDRSSLS